MENIIKSYIRRLSNLSGNNRSLQLFRILKDQFIDLHEFDFNQNEPSFEIIKKLINKQKEIRLCQDVDSRDYQSNELSRRLKKIKKTDKFLFDERGSKDLYVGWPFVRGKFTDGTIVRCPLLFFPVSLENRNNEWYLVKRLDVNVTLNKTFLLAYYHYNEQPVNEDLVETVIDNYEKDSLVFRTQLYELLKNGGIEIHFNSENFGDSLQFFKDERKEKINQEEKTGKLKMYPEAVLGVFPQSGSYLAPDYQKILKNTTLSGFEEFFFTKSVHPDHEKELENKVSEENTFTPFPIDAYQELALKTIKSGKSIVIEGPPGTGKSQLIANTISDFVARGKNVLLVCQKRAALDVVYSRLQQKGLQDFIALVHDFKNDRKPIYEQISRQINSVDQYKILNSSIDAIQLERSYLKSSRRISAIEEELEAYKSYLYDTSECQKSIKELYLSSDLEKEVIDLNQAYKTFTYDKLDEVKRKFTNYFDYSQKFENKRHFWSRGPSFEGLKTKDLIAMLEMLKEIPAFASHIEAESKKFSFRTIDFDTAEHFFNKLILVEQLRKGLEEGIVYKVYQQLHSDRPTKDIPWLTKVEKLIMSCFRGVGMETSIEAKDLGKFQEVLESAIKAKANPWSWLKWKILSHEKVFLNNVLIANQLRQTKEDFEVLVQRIDNRLNFEDATSQILDNPWLHNFPYTTRKITLQDWFYWQKRGLNMYYVSQNIRTLNEYLPVAQLDKSHYLDKLDQLIELALKIPEKLALWSKYLTIHQLRAIVFGKEDIENLQRLLRNDFDSLVAFHALKASLSREEESTLEKLLANQHTSNQAMNCFENSLAIAWIDHIETKHPELRMVNSGEMQQLTKELRDEIEKKRKISKEILLIKLREKTYEEVTFNRLHNRITYRELEHQVNKKRLIWPIRKTISEYGEDLYKLLPCWMCSPESASAIFPLKEQFDLVIFDEASQCFTERGIPAMHRGKQIVVAGDSMQLRPNDLYRIKWSDDEDDTPELSHESLLDLVKQYLSSIVLSGHYRSKSLQLIDFSNQHFYNNQLRILPDFNEINTSERPIEYLKVDGVWEDQKNEIEAETVVKIIVDLSKKLPEKSIGVVTFNYHQQDLIEEKLENTAVENSIIIPDSLFIKNIENVQGDEKDIVIFSVGYAPDKKGNFKSHFGSLNAIGGENRLNVAVTRAKEKVIVCTSIMPNQLQVEESKNDGPKLLKKYLEYAWHVHNNQWMPRPKSLPPQHFNWYLRNKIEYISNQSTDVNLINELPFADLTLKDENKYLGLILTDDESYFSSLSSKQTYVYQYLHFSTKNWKSERVYSREYWINKDDIQERIKRFIYQLTE